MDPTHMSSLVIIECNVDDMNPQIIPHTIERLLTSGARDSWATPILMKKGRPGFIISALADPEHVPELRRILLEETTSLGLREYPIVRHELERELREVDTEYGAITVKIGRDRAGAVLNVQPEYESCRRAADARQLPLKEIARAAMAAWARSEGVPR